jgi:hypothetical protein
LVLHHLQHASFTLLHEELLEMAGKQGSTGRRKTHRNPAVFAANGQDSMVDDGVDEFYNCWGNTQM